MLQVSDFLWWELINLKHWLPLSKCCPNSRGFPAIRLQFQILCVSDFLLLFMSFYTFVLDWLSSDKTSSDACTIIKMNVNIRSKCILGCRKWQSQSSSYRVDYFPLIHLMHHILSWLHWSCLYWCQNCLFTMALPSWGSLMWCLQFIQDEDFLLLGRSVSQAWNDKLTHHKVWDITLWGIKERLEHILQLYLMFHEEWMWGGSSHSKLNSNAGICGLWANVPRESINYIKLSSPYWLHIKNRPCLC